MADERKQPEEQETELADLEVYEEASEEVRGGMTKQEHVEQLSSPTDTTKRP
jgi:hypothetical protein